MKLYQKTFHELHDLLLWYNNNNKFDLKLLLFLLSWQSEFSCS
jgi:hypothetical protein